MSKSRSQKVQLIRTAVSAGKTLTAGALSNLLSTFLTNVSKLGYSTAAGMLDPTTPGAVLAVAGIFGVTEACQTAAELDALLPSILDTAFKGNR